MKSKTIRFISLFVVLFCVFSVSAQAQNKTISINVTNASLEQVLANIERSSGYKLLYTLTEEVAKVKGLTINMTNVPVEQVLRRALQDTELDFKITDNTIVLTRKAPSTPTSPKKERVLTGRVTDPQGLPIMGAHVTFEGTQIGATTGTDGDYQLKVPAGQSAVVISFIGYQTVKKTLTAQQTQLNVTLAETSFGIDDIVVNTGYQTLSKREMASAVVQVSQAELNLGSASSIDQMLAGKIAGMNVLQTSGEPGATPTIRIRGTSSILGARAPLWVLDGVILEDPVSVDLSALNSPDAQYLIGNAIAGVNARDIESVTVLKDASATAIYGVRAANGVIVVTTKKGTIGKPQINYSGNFTIDQRVNYASLNQMNAGERVALSQEIMNGGVLYPRLPTSNYGYEGLYIAYQEGRISNADFNSSVRNMVNNNTDWYKLLFRDAFSSNHTVSMSGGADRTTYYASLGYNHTNGTARTSNQQVLTGMMKVNSWVAKKLFVGFQLNASSQDNAGFHNSVDPNNYAYNTTRTLPAYNEDGSLFYYNTMQQTTASMNDPNRPKQELLYNVMNELNATGASSSISNITAQLNAQWKIGKGFTYRLLGGFDYGRTNSKTWAEDRSNYVSTKRGYNLNELVINTPEWDQCVIPVGGISTNSDQAKKAYTLRNTLDYTYSTEDRNHMISLMAANELRSVKYDGVSEEHYGWQPDRGLTVAPFLTTGYMDILGTLRPKYTDYINNNLSWIGVATYSYKDKLTLNGNVRIDGSNNFGQNPKYRFLPIWSAAAKYTISNEPYFERALSTVSYLAIRASYGIQGNIDKSSTPNMIVEVGSKNPITGLDESSVEYFANPDLRWEKTTTVNIGLDFALFAPKEPGQMDIVSGTVDFYDKMGYDMIVTRQISQVMGKDNVKINGGQVSNRGVDVSLQIVPYQNRKTSVIVKLIGSYNRNRLLSANKDIGVTNADLLSGTALIIDMPLDAFYSYQFADINQDSGYPMFYNQSGVRRYSIERDSVGLVYSGVKMAPISGGFDLGFNYKGWHFNAGFQYSIGGHARLPKVYEQTNGAFDPLSNVSKRMIDRWRKPGDQTDIPGLVLGSNAFMTMEKAYNEAHGIKTGLGGMISPVTMYDQSDVRVGSTDNLRLRDINLSYVFQPKLITKLGLQNLMLSLQARNLFQIADKAWEGRDPESGSSKIPLPRVYTFSINIGF